eukprot:m.199579 g.199579  ORF g.199579 m.199579 type:complete len:337 (+) comp17684_c0_seq6:166-1176(+)
MAAAATPASVPGFSLTQPRYDQGNFSGRFKHFLDLADPRCLAPGVFFGMTLEQSAELIGKYKSNTLAPADRDVEKLWLAKKIYTAATHPDTGEVIIQPARMSGFAIYGTPIMVGMLLPNPSMASTVFWQSINQTHNALVNYNNRNASQPTPISKILQGYAAAVVASVSIAVGLNQLVKRARVSDSVRTTLSRFVPYPAVATASTCNMLLMRRMELSTGISIKDEEGNNVGISKVAAKEAIFQTAITRVVLPAPLLITPPIVMMALHRTGIFKSAPRLALPVEAVVCSLAFIFGLPLAISLFPQEGELPVGKLEPEFQNLTTKDGKPITRVFFNKGL